MNYGLLLNLKFARVDVGNVSKKGEKYERYYYLKCFYLVVFNRTLSIYLPLFSNIISSVIFWKKYVFSKQINSSLFGALNPFC